MAGTKIVGRVKTLRVPYEVKVEVPGPERIVEKPVVVEKPVPFMTEKVIDLEPALKPLAKAVSDMAVAEDAQTKMLSAFLQAAVSASGKKEGSSVFPEFEISSNGSRIRFRQQDGKWSPWLNMGGTNMLSLPNPLPVTGSVVLDTGLQTLTERMLAKRPYNSTYRLWFETGLTDYLYTAENVAGAVATDSTFRGIRVPLDANGNPSGEVEENDAFKWSDKSGGGWT